MNNARPWGKGFSGKRRQRDDSEKLQKGPRRRRKSFVGSAEAEGLHLRL